MAIKRIDDNKTKIHVVGIPANNAIGAMLWYTFTMIKNQYENITIQDYSKQLRVNPTVCVVGGELFSRACEYTNNMET